MAIIKCDSCDKNYSDKAGACPFCQAPSGQKGISCDGSNTKACPYCAETIKLNAIRCRFCGADLTEPATRQGKMGTLDLLLLAWPWIGIGLVLLWVGNSPLIVAGKNMGIASVLVVFGSALLIAMDANQKGVGNLPDPKTGKIEGGPLTWFFGALLLWIAIYPLYMFRRARYGAKSNGAACLIGALLFAGISVYYTGAISAEHSKIRAQLEQSQREINRSMREMERLLR